MKILQLCHNQNKENLYSEEMPYRHNKQNVGVKFLSVYTPSA